MSNQKPSASRHNIISYQEATKQERHDNQFKGWFIPAVIVELFETGQITATELVLLAKIDGLVKYEGKGRKTKHGCWASNSFLGEKMGGLHRNHVARLIGRLRDLRLLFEYHYKDDDRRFLETKWSPITSRYAIRGPDPKKYRRKKGQKQPR